MSEFLNVVKNIKDFLSLDCSSSRWFAEAYVSWYRGCKTINLQGVESLDSSNLILFCKMLQLRRMRGWDERPLFELERYAIEYYQL